jgi:hypothetical protein
MKAYPMVFTVDNISPAGLDRINVVCTVVRSFADKYRSDFAEPSEYQLDLPSEVASRVSINDTLKVVLYSERPLKTVEDYQNFMPIGKRVEVMHSNSDSWELIAEEMNNEVA